MTNSSLPDALTDPLSWRPLKAPSLVEFEVIATEAYRRLPARFRAKSAPVQMPNMVWLYRVPILLYWAEHEEALGAIIKHVLVHEIGHHFGLSDDDIEQIERAAD